MLLYLRLASLKLSYGKAWFKNKNPLVWDQNSLFKYFWAEIWNCYCHNWNKCPQVCLIATFGARIKMPKFGTKNALFGYFSYGWNLKNYCHIWNQHPGICQKWVFNSYSEFWYIVRFFKRSRVLFLYRFGSGSGSTL